jgi:hypothetical protein
MRILTCIWRPLKASRVLTTFSMLTIFTLPKPFDGEIGVIQRNAVRSWKQLGRDCQIILCGDGPDLDNAASELGVDSVAGIACNSFGTPLVNSAFARVTEVARHDVLCFTNADLLFFPDFLRAIEDVSSKEHRFLIVGESWDVHPGVELPEEVFAARPQWEADLRHRVSTAGTVRGPEWIDFFVFRRGTIGALPEFAVGRPGWDNWMIWHARASRMPVVDISPSTLVVHQKHDYAHIPASRGPRWEGPEGDANRMLLGFRQGDFSLHYATHRLVSSALLPNRIGGVRRRVRIELLLHRWTIPIYRLLRLSYHLLAARRPPPG